MITNIITDNGKNIMLNRYLKSVPDYLPPSQFKVGINNGVPTEISTDVDSPIPISNGIINDDGSNTLTGDISGINTTNNTDTYKPGAGVSDDTAQNLLTNTTTNQKGWILANLASAGIAVDTSKYLGLWLYILDQTTLDKFQTSGTSFQIEIGDDAINYFYKPYTTADLSTGWNWLSTYPDTVADLDVNGTPSSSCVYFVLRIVTNVAADTFAAGDVIYDLLRTFDDDDTLKDFVSGYPTFDEANKTATVRCYINSVEANGFPFNAVGIFNKDATRLMSDITEFNEESKADTDEYAFIITNEVL